MPILNAALILCGLLGQPSAPSVMDFDAVINKHLGAIKTRDLKSFTETITGDDSITLILPNGHYSKTRREFLTSIQTWFQEKDWRFSYQIESRVHTPELGLVVLRVAYDDMDSDQKPYHLDYFLTLVFKKSSSGWFLIHDQNTLINPKQP
ncbi:MAG: nuclear transport factor 2 family protein [Acidobacteria bacterium]|nr:nuclear transport factor 2 family protein [Acidobacteriota bacterium]MBI3489922.1 nuclear transport factor 2 family protein [Acidobacteriota bacterium]